ncbi:hypothetical protein G4O51_04365 [Candidatus Bathyarchaeota archaeon A05DMB-2]|nr:hypothetical protein [Candidatus Bathyarchaeota archaeon A05DMB-2]
MNFSTALIIFSAILLPLCFILLELARRRKSDNLSGREFKPRIFLVIALSAFSLMGILVILQFLAISSSLFFFILYPAVTALLLLAVLFSNKSQKTLIVFAVIIFHLVLLSLLLPPASGITVDERSSAIVRLAAEGHWDTSWTYIDPYYNPFPLDLGMFYSASVVTTLNSLSTSLGWIVYFFFIVAYDSTLYAITRRLGGSWRVGALSILIFAFTPPAFINPQPQCIASLFLLLFVLAFFEAFIHKPTFSLIVLSNLCFAIAILVHGTAAIGVVLLLILLVASYILPKIRRAQSFGSYKKALLLPSAITLTIITLSRWIYFGGLNRIQGPLDAFIIRLLGGAQTGIGGSTYVPLYDQAVSPLGAYAWSLPLSLAAALVLYYFIHKNSLKDTKTLAIIAMCLTAILLQLVGFLGSVFSSNVGLQRYLGQASFVLLIPAAAIAGIKILNGSSRIIAGFLVLIVLFSGIGLADPVFSPSLYSNVNTVNSAKGPDFVEVQNLYNILASPTTIVSTYEILTAFSYVNIALNYYGKQINAYAGSSKTNRLMAENLTSGYGVSGLVYLWTPDLSVAASNVSVNLVYNSGRHVAVIER